MFSKTILSASLLAFPQVAFSAYHLQDDYTGSGMWDMFDFFTGTDPTNGLVDYVDQGTAQSSGLIKQQDGGYYIGVDNTNSVGSEGRPSVRLESKKTYESGLVIIDLAHMPSSACGSWPAFWMTDPDNWPTNGEIDIIEGVNDDTTNQMTLHTGPGCSIGNQNGFSGSVASGTSCDSSGSSNAGCGITDPEDSSYGNGFNNAEGGVYATEITDSTISIWQFTSDQIPSDIKSGNPDPSGWTTPVAQWKGGCDVATSFNSQKIIFDITFCGDWAGDAYPDTCPDTCENTVMNSPETYSDTYWLVNSLKVYGGSSSGNGTYGGGNGTNGTYGKRDMSSHMHHGRHSSNLLRHIKA